MQEAGEERRSKQTEGKGGGRLTVLSCPKKKEVRSTAAPGITPVTDLLPLPWL